MKIKIKRENISDSIKRKFNLRKVNGKTRKSNLKYPENFNKECHYLEALYSTLIQIKPKYCIEIGTHKGDNSTKVFQEYFDNYCNEGLLITLDIVPCSNLNYKNVKQVLVYPHHQNITTTCGANGKWFAERDLKNDYRRMINKTVSENINIVKKEMEKNKIDFFDFAFIDGDHEIESIKNDMKICKDLTRFPHYTIIDDTKEEIHPCCHYYQEVIKNDSDMTCYDFDDWNVFVGASLVMWN